MLRDSVKMETGRRRDSFSDGHRKPEDWVPAFSRYLGSYKISDVSFE